MAAHDLEELVVEGQVGSLRGKCRDRLGSSPTAGQFEDGVLIPVGLVLFQEQGQRLSDIRFQPEERLV